MANYYFLLLASISIIFISLSSSFKRGLSRAMTFKVNHKTSLKDSAQSVKWDLSLQSPSKINLFLRILGRRPSGYHDLASLFQAISLSDYMHFKKLDMSAKQDILTCSDPTLTVDNNNLVLKALNLMRNKTNVNHYFQVHLNKVVPIQAGLGGGSGNAATAMYAFNKLCGYPCSLDDLRLWSGDIGSDITFFFTSGTAYCTGRGEIVDSKDKLPQADETIVHIFKPIEGLSTPLVFKTLNLNKTSSVSPEQLLDSYMRTGALHSAENGLLLNDLEPPSFQCEPILNRIKQEINNQESSISGCMMSGSGTSIYALERKSADKAINKSIFNPSLVISKFPEVRHFECRFLNKEDNKESWYD